MAHEMLHMWYFAKAITDFIGIQNKFSQPIIVVDLRGAQRKVPRERSLEGLGVDI